MDREERDRLGEELASAAMEGELDRVREISALLGPRFNHSDALFSAASQGMRECVAFLLPLARAKKTGPDALEWALRSRLAPLAGRPAGADPAGCVRAILPWVSQERVNVALRMAAARPQTEAMAELIAAASASGRLNALGIAAGNGQQEHLSALLPPMEEWESRPWVFLALGRAREAKEAEVESALKGWLSSQAERAKLLRQASKAAAGASAARARRI